MRTVFRATATAATALIVLAAAGFAGPSTASEADGTAAISYTEHASSGLESPMLGLNEAETTRMTPADGFVSPAPVAAHAAARATPIPFAAEVDDESGASARSLAELVADYAAGEAPDEETDCLARGIYYESKGEPLEGQLSVAEVILNRARSDRFPSTICGVLRQPGQFSFVRRGVIPQPPRRSRHWRVAVAIAQIAMTELAEGRAPGALFFHARSVHPNWRRERVATIGNHVFYR